jgi:hypothetical protein
VLKPELDVLRIEFLAEIRNELIDLHSRWTKMDWNNADKLLKSLSTTMS